MGFKTILNQLYLPRKSDKPPGDTHAHSTRTYGESCQACKLSSSSITAGEVFSILQKNFILAYPQYQSSALDSIRQTEYKRLNNIVYLDYTGASLYPESLVKQSHDYLNSAVLGNPHSTNPSYVSQNNSSSMPDVLTIWCFKF